ncbi:DUF7351 domain-containing protein [Halobaculum litoreum]|uniref:DUF7351 domain-containing protein n=1 Tax=Halobaculum litoreum TaxID=3031998 RepID=UPI0024C448BD|nr:helix-turn-helix transcriptional regulator [Halobaculum sp. DT92]
MSEETTERAGAAFSFLGDGLRLAVLRALAAGEPPAGPREGAVAYSDLRREVGERDSGKFSYHLDKLTGRFVEKVDGGYRLREPGREVVRLLDRGVVDGPAEFEPTAVPARCPLCGGDVHVRYGDHHVVTCCGDCEGLFGADGTPDGTLTGVVLPPATVEGRDPAALFEHAHRVFRRRLRAMVDGLCLECGGDVERRLRRCPDHDAPTGRTCGTCGTAYPVLAELVCTVCGRGRVTHPLFGNPDTEDATVVADPARPWDRLAALLSWDATALPGDAAGEVAFERPDGRVRVVLDDDLGVAE